MPSIIFYSLRLWDPVTQRLPLGLALVYLLRFAKSWDFYSIIIMLSDRIDIYYCLT